MRRLALFRHRRTLPAVRRRMAALRLRWLLSPCGGRQASAAVRDYYFERAGGTHGLAQNTVTALAQDARRLRLGRHPGRPASLRRPALHALPAGSARPRQPARQLRHRARRATAGHGLWIGTYSQYVARLDLATAASAAIRRASTRRQPAQPPGVRAAGRRTRRLWSAPRAAWSGSTRPAAGARRCWRCRPQRPAGQPQALLRDRDGALWYATAAGLYRLDRRGGGRAASVRPMPLHAAAARSHPAGCGPAASDGLYLVCRRPAHAGAGLAQAGRRRRRHATSARWPKRPTATCGCRSAAAACGASIRAAARRSRCARTIRLPGDAAGRLDQRADGRPRRDALGRRPVPWRRGRRHPRRPLSATWSTSAPRPAAGHRARQQHPRRSPEPRRPPVAGHRRRPPAALRPPAARFEDFSHVAAGRQQGRRPGSA